MEFENYQSIWLNEEEQTPAPGGSVVSQPLQLLRESTVRDWERSRERSKVIFSFLFAFLAIVAALAALPQGTSPVLAFLLAFVLLIEGAAQWVILAREKRDSDWPIRDYLLSKHRQTANQTRLESCTQLSLLILTGVAVVLTVAGPRLSESPAAEMDRVASMLILTVFLSIAWLKGRAVSSNRKWGQELQSYLNEMDE